MLDIRIRIEETSGDFPVFLRRSDISEDREISRGNSYQMPGTVPPLTIKLLVASSVSATLST